MPEGAGSRGHVPLIRADGSADGTWEGVQYDRASGVCSTGVAPLMSIDEYTRRVEAGRGGGACTDVAIASTPGSTGYPAALSRAGITGSAQVLVVVDANGRALEAHAVCASVPGFAAPAVSTALAIRYRPVQCDGEPSRAVALVPFAYDL